MMGTTCHFLLSPMFVNKAGAYP